MYIKRTVEKQILTLSEKFPVVLVTGARQVGKSTMLNHIKEPNRKYVSLDDLAARSLAIEDPKLFLETYSYPIIIDEIQRVPSLFIAIKQVVDELALLGKPNKGLYWLTGSQQFSMMKNVSDSLVGRVAIVNMASLSQNEILQRESEIFSLDLMKLKERSEKYESLGVEDVYKMIFNGGMPALLNKDKFSREQYFKEYVNTYLVRDVRDFTRVGDLMTFQLFLEYIAARTATPIVYSTAAKELGVSTPTIKSWTSILEALGVIYLLYPYHSNITKRLVKAPKVYFLDTGLCSYLTRWPSAEVLQKGAMSGAILETFVVSEIVKNYYNFGKRFDFFYYRDFDQKEIDLVFTDAISITPVEIKKNINPLHADKHFSVLNKFNLNINPGIILSLAKDFMPLNRNTYICPISII